MTERAQNADCRRKPQIFADSPLLLEIQAFGGHRKPQEIKPEIFVENRRSGSITLGPSCHLKLGPRGVGQSKIGLLFVTIFMMAAARLSWLTLAT